MTDKEQERVMVNKQKAIGCLSREVRRLAEKGKTFREVEEYCSAIVCIALDEYKDYS